LETKLLSGLEITPSDFSSVTDESINTVLLPNHGPGSPGVATTKLPLPQKESGSPGVTSSTLQDYPMPKEYATPVGNRSTYAYIQELFQGEFNHNTPASSMILRSLLNSQPATAKKILENLGLQHFNSLHKLQGKIKTYKIFLKKQKARFWSKAPL